MMGRLILSGLGMLAMTLLAGPSASAQRVVPFIDCMPGPWIVFMKRDSARPDKETKAKLDQVVETHAGVCGGFTLRIIAHSDQGERSGIDRRRAAAVRDYLKRHGIAVRFLETEAMGARDPRVRGKPGAAEPQNQRVELLPGPPP